MYHPLGTPGNLGKCPFEDIIIVGIRGIKSR